MVPSFFISPYRSGARSGGCWHLHSTRQTYEMAEMAGIERFNRSHRHVRRSDATFESIACARI